MSLTLSDGLSHYRSVSDATHRFWAYFQAIALGAAAFAWSREPPELGLFVFLSLGFGVFAWFNGRLVRGSQAEAVATADAVKRHAERLEAAARAEVEPGEREPSSDLLCIAKSINPEPAAGVAAWHWGLSVATLAAIWWRYFTFRCM